MAKFIVNDTLKAAPASCHQGWLYHWPMRGQYSCQEPIRGRGLQCSRQLIPRLQVTIDTFLHHLSVNLLLHFGSRSSRASFEKKPAGFENGLNERLFLI